MTNTIFSSTRDVGASRRAGLALLVLSAALGQEIRAQAPATNADLTITPPGRTNPTQKGVDVTLKLNAGTFLRTPAITFVPPVITASKITMTDGKTLTATFTVAGNATGIVLVTAKEDGGTPYSGTFDTGVVCLESLASTGCALRWEVITSSATGSSSQTKTNTAPNILFRLDYQFRSPRPSIDAVNAIKGIVGRDGVLRTSDLINLKTNLESASSKRGFKNRFAAHAIVETGYTQAPTSSMLNSLSSPSGSTSTGNATQGVHSQATGGTTPATSQCPSSSSTCMAATQQQAFVADAKLTFGWTVGQDGQGTYSEFGFAARGAFQDLLQANQVVQSGGIQYVDLSSANLKNAVGLYEGVARFRLAHHDTPPALTGSNAGKFNHNSSSLLVLEAGYQNNSGLQQLSANPQVSTRNRFVGRFSAYPEIPGTNHTKVLVGFEYSGGINGGAHVVQLFFGANLNPVKLFTSGTPQSTPVN